jgi:hypothetical protein
MRSVTADVFEERLVVNSMLELRHDDSAIPPFRSSKDNCADALIKALRRADLPALSVGGFMSERV